MMEIITFANKNLNEFGVFFDGSQLFQTPQRDVSFVPVSGRSGDIVIDNGRYLNQEITIPCFIRENFNKRFPELMNYLLSFDDYQKLETTTLPDVYFMAKLVSSIQPVTGVFNKSGMFDLVFNCMPQKWLKWGDNNEITIDTNTATFKFYSYYKIKPVPLISMTGNGNFYINGKEYSIVNNSGKTIYIDFFEKEVYYLENGRKTIAAQCVLFPDLRFDIELQKDEVENAWYIDFTPDTNSITVKTRWYRL